MTGGIVVIIGKTGRNFAAGMSGGEAFVLDEDGDFEIRCNTGMVGLEKIEDAEDVEKVKSLLAKHVQYTQSPVAENILENWNDYQSKFVKIMPTAYKKVLADIKRGREKGLTEEEAIMEAANG
jgi:glutamate synthase (ferredoxin)